TGPSWADVTVERVLFGRMRLTVSAVSMAAAVALVTCSACGSDHPTKASRSVPTPTTQIAGAGVLGNDRKADESCAKDAAAPDPGPATRPAHNVEGVTPDVVQVPSDPQRIVVLSGDQL